MQAGHLFEEPLMRGHSDIRTHLEDLAHRHPEFADQLRYPAWSSDNRSNTNTWGRKRQHDAGEASKQQPEGEHSPQESNEPTEDSEPARGRPKENLRNTVPDMGQKQQQETEEKESRGQRSWSAPPDNRTQGAEKPRFVSKIEIHPVNPDATSHTQTGDSTKPPMAPPKSQPQQPQQTQQPKQSNVRHIPIFVEGRDEPILPKNVEPEFTQSHAPPPQHFSRPQQPQQFASTQHHFQPQPPPQQHFEPSPQPKPQPPPPQKPQQPEQPPVNPRDPLFRVGLVQKEVDELKDKVEKFNGNSRSDKEYILLDELLTRNLIKLDDIETEGKEDVRAARKNTIKSIQRCISVLENKVPVSGGEKNGEAMQVEQGTSESTTENPDEKLVSQQSVGKENEEKPASQSSDITMDQAAGDSKPMEYSTENNSNQQIPEEKPMDIETQTVEGSQQPNTNQLTAEEEQHVPGEKTKESPLNETTENKSA